MKLILCSFLFFLSLIKSTFACEKIEYSNKIKNSNFDLNILSLQGNLKKIDKVINGLPDGFYKEYILGVSFLDGKTKLVDLKEAEKHLINSAKYCFSPAHYSLGYLYYLENKLEDSKKWLLSAKKLGDSLAAYQLGLIYIKEHNPEKMLESLDFAEKTDFTPAITELGVQYYDGKIINKDLTKAFKYFEKAALRNDPLAQNNVGWMYENGEGGVKVNKEKALYWYRKAYDNGFSGAYENYSRLLGKK